MKKVLVIQTAFLGDSLLAIPLLKNLRLLEPQSEITLVCRKGLSSIFTAFALANTVLELDKNNAENFKTLKSQLQKQDWDLVLCPHESYRSHILVFGLKAKLKIGFKKWWNFFVFHQRVRRPLSLPDAMRQLSLLTPLSQEIANKIEAFAKTYDSKKTSVKVPAWASMKIEMPTAWIQEQLEGLGFYPKSPYVCIAPGSVWETKKWKKERYADLTKNFLQQGFSVLIIGAKEDHEACDFIAAANPEAIPLCGKTSLLQVYAIFHGARFLVSNDSGPMHMAAVSGLPSVAIFGPTVLSIGYRPWQDDAIVVEKDLFCRPCGKHGHKKCPRGTHECMQLVEVSDVERAIENIKRRS